MIFDCLLDSLTDSLKLLPFLFLTYLIMEYLEHKSGSKMQDIIKKAGKGGPLIGGILGAFPQCGFSAAASNLYAGRIITIGTLVAVYLSTSDEMLPIMISENAGLDIIGKFLIIKVLIGMVVGFVIDFILRKRSYEQNIHHICEEHHCHCEKGIVKSAIHHTLEIFLYILIISFVLNLVISIVGIDAIKNIISDKPLLGSMVAGLIGLIPNCAGSVVITELYLTNVISFGVALSGLLAGSGVGILVLFRVNDDFKDNIRVLITTYAVSVIIGFVIGLI